jgi:filamentous hemagglutinin family protein
MSKMSSTDLSLKILSLGLISNLTSLQSASALPQEGNVAVGEININLIHPNHLQINQTSDRGIINWDSFNIEQSQTVNISQPNQNSVLLNRVTGHTSSIIGGNLASNGQIFLVNPNGILFTSTAQINVGGLLATTLDIKDTDFINNNLQFFSVSGKSPATVENYGNITIEETGIGALVAPGVINSGVINARLGKVILGATERFTLDFYGDGLVSIVLDPVTTSEIITADGREITALVSNSGAIYNDGGSVYLQAATASELLNQTINMDGIIQAKTAKNIDGKIVLSGETGEVNVSGRLDTSGVNGGEIYVLGEQVFLNNAIIDVSGLENGGFVETSGHSLQTQGVEVNLKGGINNGSWLIDPSNIVIQDTASDLTINGNTFAGDQDLGLILKKDLETALASGNVIITTAGGGEGDGDLILDATINSQSGNGLTLTARKFMLNSGSFEIDGDLTFNLNQVNPLDHFPSSSINDAVASVGTITIPKTTTINIGEGNSGQVTVAGDTINLNKNAHITINGVGEDRTFLDGENTRQVVNVSAGEITLNDITIQNGKASNGGGIFHSGGTVTLNNSTITNNSAENMGGGIFHRGDEVILNNSTVTGNFANSGEDLFNSGGKVTINNSSVSSVVETSTNPIDEMQGIKPSSEIIFFEDYNRQFPDSSSLVCVEDGLIEDGVSLPSCAN